MSIFWPQTSPCGKQACLDPPTSPIPAVSDTEENYQEDFRVGEAPAGYSLSCSIQNYNAHPECGVGNSGGNIPAV